jgi:hypothetical protein
MRAISSQCRGVRRGCWRRRAPCEGAVGGDEGGGNFEPIAALERLDYRGASHQFVVAAALLVGERFGAGMGPEHGRRASCLCRGLAAGPGPMMSRMWNGCARCRRYSRRLGRARVGGSIRGGKETSESLSAVERNQCDVVDVVVGTGDAARLDRDDPLIAVESADVPEASRGKPVVGELVVRLEHQPTESLFHATGRRSRAGDRLRVRSRTRG